MDNKLNKKRKYLVVLALGAIAIFSIIIKHYSMNL